MAVRLTSVLLVTVVILNVLNRSFAVRCFECQNIADPAACRSVVTCAPTEHCYIEQIVTVAGAIAYNTGCNAHAGCSLGLTGTLVGRRMVPGIDQRHLYGNDANINERATDISLCIDCCQNDFCNNEGCGTHATPPSQRGPYCFSCDSTQDPAKCNNVSVCDQAEVCLVYIPTEFIGLSDTLYRSECISSVACMAISHAHINSKCPASCCYNDYCNDACALTTSPVFPTATSAHSNLPTAPVQITTLQTHTSGCQSDHFHDDITGMCIQIIENQLLSYQEAKQACESTGDRLVTVDSHEKTTFVDSMILYHSSIQLAKDRIYWTSAYDLHNKTEYYWLNGENMVYTNWGGGDEVAPNQQPDDRHEYNQDCVLLWGADGYRWADDHCWTKRNFICENPSTLLHTGSSTLENPCKTGHFYDTLTGICIKIMESQTHSYSAAKSACEHFGDQLVTIDSPEKTIFIDNILIHQSTLLDERSRTYWIGAYDRHNNDNFLWPNGQAIHYTNWGGGNEVAPNQQPDMGSQDCVALYGPDHYRWHDDKCSSAHYYICESTTPGQAAPTTPAPIPTAPHGPLCYTCDAMDQPGECTNTTTCGPSQECLLHVSPELSAAAGHAVYTSSCAFTTACAVIASLHGSDDCHAKCCNTDLCNNECAVKADPCPSSDGWQTVHKDTTSMCIKIHTNHATWDTARHQCQGDHGDLVVMDTSPKMALIRNLLTNSYSAETSFWFGAYDKDLNNQFVWVNTNARVSHGDWDSGQPNHHDGGRDQNCALLWRNSNVHFQWHDDYCQGRYGFVCERTQ